MKKAAGIPVRIIFWVMSGLLLGIVPQAGALTSRHSSSFEEAGAESPDAVEEAQLLYKLGRRQEARRLTEALLSLGRRDPSLLEIAAFLALERGDLGRVKELIEELEKVPGRDDTASLDLSAAYHAARRDWKEARPDYERLLELRPGDPDLLSAYAQTVTALRDRRASEKAYRALLKERALSGAVWDYQKMKEFLAPRLETSFLYRHRPGSERNWVLKQGGHAFLYPWWAFGASVGEEIYRRQESEGIAKVGRELITHEMNNRFYLGDHTILSAGWESVYYDRQTIQGVSAGADFRFSYWASEWEYVYNRAVRDPIEALLKEGKMDRLRALNKLMFWDRFEIGHEIMVDWYRLDGSLNDLVPGADHLGHKVSQDFFASLTLWRVPYIALNYHYRRGHWDQKFSGADTVVPFLPEEQIHAGGVYVEHTFQPHLRVWGSATRGSDRKRHVDFTIWNTGADLWIRSRCKAAVSYEYDYGDSGTGGAGNSQIMSGSLNYYF